MKPAAMPFLRACRARSPEVIVLRALSLIVLLLTSAPRLPAMAGDGAENGFWGRLTLCLAGGAAEDDASGGGARAATCPACLVSCQGAVAPPVGLRAPLPSSGAGWRVTGFEPAEPPPPLRRALRFEPRAPPATA